MKILFLAFLSLFLSPTHAAFNFSLEGLCFKNGTSELRRFGPLGKLGNKKGICQGMSGIVAAFHEHAQFNPSTKKMDQADAYWALSEIIRYHSGGCGLKKKVRIDGFSNLQELCSAYKDLFMSTAIAYNTDIAIREISWNLDSFLIHQDSPISGGYDRLKLHQNVQSLSQMVNKGQWPLMLYYSHVVAVHNVEIKYKSNKIEKVIFGIYDSNYATSISYTIPYSEDGLPSPGQKMIWNTTPNRLTTFCW